MYHSTNAAAALQFPLPSWRDAALLATVGFLLILHGLPALSALAQDEAGSELRAALSTAFTFQGRLTGSGLPADGSYDFEFALYDTNVGGTALATLPPLNGVAVVNGLFAVQLDFGSNAFTGDRRWVEARVRPAGQGGAFTTLGRQELTATPYALYARASDWSGIRNIPSGLSDGDDNTTYSPASPLNLQGTTFGFSISGCTAGEVWKYTGTGWSCDPDIVGSPGTTYTAGTGLMLNDTEFAVDFGTGPDEVATGDHTHVGQSWFGTGLTGLRVATNDVANANALRGTALQGTGVEGSGRIGVSGGSSSNTGAGVDAGNGASPCNAISAPCVAVRATSLSGTGIHATGAIYAVDASAISPGGIGVNAVGAAVGVRGVGATQGVLGTSQTFFGADGAGVVGKNLDADGTHCTNTDAALSLFCVGVHGESTLRPASIGVSGVGNWIGVRGEAKTPGGYGGLFVGKLFHSGAIETSSDARLKMNIAEPAGLDEILALNPVSFEWKPDAPGADSQRHQGLLAQEVEEVLPELVEEVPASGLEANLAVNYSELIPVLIRAVQEQQEQIDGQTGTGVQAATSGPSGWTSTWGAALAGGLAGSLLTLGGLVALNLRSRSDRGVRSLGQA